MQQQVDPRLLFATHYHPLCAEFAGSARITQGHMAALVGAQQQCVGINSSGGGGSDSSQGITFLYRLQPGPCPKSYGLQVSGCADKAAAAQCSAVRALSPAGCGCSLALEPQSVLTLSTIRHLLS